VKVDPAQVRLVPWSEEDLPLLVRLNAPEMTEHLGGPETEEQVLLRHQRYVAVARSGIFRDSESAYRAFAFKAVLEPLGVGVGSIGFWEREWKGEQVYEMGWGVVPEHQGRGIASAAVMQAVELARATKARAAVHAFPSIENAPSNATCRRVGFELLGTTEFEYPKGHWMIGNDWRMTL
jgi:RimJ/RimL family protein N-acetyltransferase